MKKEDFDALQQALHNGDMDLLGNLFLDYRSYCLGLLHRYNCPQADAEDIYMEAIMAFRTKVMAGGIDNTNVKAYVGKITQNIYLQRLRKKQKTPNTLLNVSEVESYLQAKENGGNQIFDPMVEAENQQSEQAAKQRQIDAIVWAKKKLGKQCQELLEASIVDGIKPRHLLDRFSQFKNVNVLKTTKNRCKKRLQGFVEQFITQKISSN